MVPQNSLHEYRINRDSLPEEADFQVEVLLSELSDPLACKAASRPRNQMESRVPDARRQYPSIKSAICSAIAREGQVIVKS